MKLSQIARALGGELRGDGGVEIVDVAPIEDAPPGTLTFLADRRLAVRHAGAVIGSDGFGYLPLPEGIRKIPQIGTVVLEDDVSVGANATVDRAALGATVVGRGTKIDNLVMVAHGCRIGPECLLAAQVGLSGSSTLGARVLLGGQVGLAGHQTVGDRAQVAAKSGVHGDVPAGAVYGGYPATEVRVWRRASAALLRLPEALRRLRRVERALGLGVEPPSEE